MELGGFASLSSADQAEMISNTSFYVLMLIGSFTQVENATQFFSEVSGIAKNSKFLSFRKD